VRGGIVGISGTSTIGSRALLVVGVDRARNESNRRAVTRLLDGHDPLLLLVSLMFKVMID